jgi:hypothetical protein
MIPVSISPTFVTTNGTSPLPSRVSRPQTLTSTFTIPIAGPLIVLQGKNDPRVIKPESDEIVGAIKKKGGAVDT